MIRVVRVKVRNRVMVKVWVRKRGLVDVKVKSWCTWTGNLSSQSGGVAVSASAFHPVDPCSIH